MIESISCLQINVGDNVNLVAKPSNGDRQAMVASGKVYGVAGGMNHTTQILHDQCKVSVLDIIDEDPDSVDLPIPYSKADIFSLAEAIDTFILWPESSVYVIDE